MKLEHLFDSEYRYEGPPIVSARVDGGEGRGFGGGTGSVSGDRIQGRVRWSNFPHFRSDGVIEPDVTGVIETNDGARVLFRIGGYSLPAERGRRVVGPVTFVTQDDSYLWLNSVVAVSDGVLDRDLSGIRTRVYECVPEMR